MPLESGLLAQVYVAGMDCCSSRVKHTKLILASCAGPGCYARRLTLSPLKGFMTHLLSFEYAGGQSFGSWCLHELVFSCAERGSRDPPHQDQAASTRYASHPSMPMPCPAPRPVKYLSQWRGSAAAAASGAPEPQLHRQVVQEQPAERPAAQQLQPVNRKRLRHRDK